MATIDDLLAVNGASDDEEPWAAADYCDLIEVDGADLVALCEDGVALWSNRDREWSEVTPDEAGALADRVRDAWAGGNDEAAERLLGWMAEFWPCMRLH